MGSVALAAAVLCAAKATRSIRKGLEQRSTKIKMHPVSAHDDDELMLNVLRCHETY